jgi:hypothetical protein
MPAVAVAEEAAGAIVLGEGGDLVTDLLEAVSPAAAVGEAEVDLADALPIERLLISKRVEPGSGLGSPSAGASAGARRFAGADGMERKRRSSAFPTQHRLTGATTAKG